jgi:stage II sporulation protein R
MGGVFMKKAIKRVVICFMLAALMWCGTLLADRERLNRELIRLHIVANSDSNEDQWRKLLVRDAIVEYLRLELKHVTDVELAKQYIQEKLPQLKEIAEKTLYLAGCEETVEVSMAHEAFDRRDYDTFSLPAGVYEALRIVIGEGEGENWWCVVFPGLCASATTEGFADTAAGAGFSDTLTDTLRQEQGYEVRFFLLDCLGWLQNWLFDR